MEDQNTKITGKLKALSFTLKKTDDVIAKENEEASERQKNSITTMIVVVNNLKESIEEQMFASGETEEQVSAWNQDIESQLAEADDNVKKLSEHVLRIRADRRAAEDAQERQESLRFKQAKFEQQQAHEDLARQQQLEFERHLLDQKLEYQKKLEDAHPDRPKKGAAAKLPKLVITRFNGSYHDWLRFWGQFSAEIDSADIADVMKFSYLKELVEPKIRSSIDGLPFTAAGYERAKSILADRYGNTSEIVNSYVEEIINLPTLTTANPAKIHSFYDKLMYCVQSLETLKRLSDVNGHVRLTLNKLPGIRGDLVRTEPGWKEWDFTQLVAALRAWTERNPVEVKHEEKPQESPYKRRDKPSRVFQTRQAEHKTRACVYCDTTDHKSSSCNTVTSSAERKRLLTEKRLCYNCTGAKHRASECTSKITCQNCAKRHHSSICDQQIAAEKMLTARRPDDAEVVYPVVIIEVEGVKCRALLDTGAGSSYASGNLLDQLHRQPTKTETKRIEMLLGATTTRVEVYKVKVRAVEGDFTMEVNLTKVHKPQLMHLENPQYENLLKKYPHLSGVKMNDTDRKPQLPVHVVLGAGEYAMIKTQCAQRVGLPGQPVAEKTLLGWTIMSPGRETNSSPMLLTQTSSVDYEQLCRLDVLGLADAAENDQGTVYAEFKEQLIRNPAGWYETALPWKGNHPDLPNNEQGSQRRLQSLLRKLKRTDNTEKYDAVIQEQLQKGVVEQAPATPRGREFYIPHKPVIRENAESTKLRVVYDASAREREGAPSLNDCLHTGPPLQNKLWSVLVRERFHPVAIAGDLQKAFLQVRIREDDRDALRFHWKSNEHSETETLRFTRALFGLAPSPFLLGGVIEHHLDSWESRMPGVVAEIRRSLYVDDLISGSTTVSQAKALKESAIEVFADATFKLHKWNSNIKELEPPDEDPKQDDEETYAKQHLGAKANESKILGLPWDKQKDTLRVVYPQERAECTKRGILANLAKVYDPLGLVSPTTLSGKFIYRDICDLKSAWDAPAPGQLVACWQRWRNSLPPDVTLPRSLVRHQEAIQSIELHAFGDASGNGVSAAVYAVITQESGTSQGLVTAKARLAKRNTTIPRLELVSAHMAANLASNVRNALARFPVTKTHCWLDSSVALHWIRGQGEYKQFVANRVHKIQTHADLTWRHVPTAENPADLGSRGGSVTNAELWWNGPEWLNYRKEWPPEIVIKCTPESKAEAKVSREVLATAVEQRDGFDELLNKHRLWRVLRTCAWVSRFLYNCRRKTSERTTGPLSTEEIEGQKLWWTRRVQGEAKNRPKFQEERMQLNLQENHEGILECRGRIQGEYPIYLPDSHLYTEKLVEDAHLRTLHGGVGLTMVFVRNNYWVPRLRQLTKRVRRGCWGCKRFQATAVAAPPPGSLPTTRTEGTSPFQVIGVDFAGPIKFQTKRKVEGKAYLALYACSLTRGLYLELLPNLETEEFLGSLKRLVARRGRPKVIYSDNGGTFVGAAKWLRQVMRDEKINNYLAEQGMEWRFNLSRAPWWGGQFERMVGLVKSAMYKTIGQGHLSWKELQDVILDVEVALNNRPLGYVEDDVQLPVLTPNALLFGQPSTLPELEPHHIENVDLRKRARYLQRCKEAMWSRWTKEYLRGLRERHNLKHAGRPFALSVGEVVIIKSEERNRGKWPLGIVVELIAGRDGVVRAAKLRAGKSHLERAVQHLYPLELSCDWGAPRPNLGADAPVFRPRRDAAVAAGMRIRHTAEDEQ